MKEEILNHESIVKLMTNSPIRKSLDKNIPFKDLIIKKLEENIDNIKFLEEKNDDVLKIVVVGEVKSGKSSLVNELVSKDVSDVDVLESTTNIIELVYGETLNKSVSDKLTRLEIDLEYLKEINIVDTPGLRSITEKNEITTIEYLKNADLILFVIDATHIGQEDIFDTLDMLCSYKKPIVFVLNKCDLLEDDKSEVLDYVKDGYSLYSDKFFMVSSYLEYQDRIGKISKAEDNAVIVYEDIELRNQFMLLKEYIKSLKIKNKELKFESFQSSKESIIHKEIINTYEYQKSIEIVLEELKKYNLILNKKFEFINSKIEFEVQDWIYRILMNDEIYAISENIEKAKDYINEVYIKNIVNNKKGEFDELFFNEWIESLKEISIEIKDDIRKYIDNININGELLYTPSIEIEDEKINLNEMLTTVGTGAILGATSGGVASLYAAGLSGSAASLTIGGALLTYCPPLLFAGTIGGAVGKVIYEKLKKDQKNSELFNEIQEFIIELKSTIEEKILFGYINSSKEIVSKMEYIYKTSKKILISNYELERIIEDTQVYLDELNKYIEQ